MGSYAICAQVDHVLTHTRRGAIWPIHPCTTVPWSGRFHDPSDGFEGKGLGGS